MPEDSESTAVASKTQEISVPQPSKNCPEQTVVHIPPVSIVGLTPDEKEATFPEATFLYTVTTLISEDQKDIVVYASTTEDDDTNMCAIMAMKEKELNIDPVMVCIEHGAKIQRRVMQNISELSPKME